jgi:hypothetical protein
MLKLNGDPRRNPDIFLSLRDIARNIRIACIYKCEGRMRKEKLKLI